VLDVSRALSITVGGASKVVDRVETSGWCRRSPHPLDGRSNVLGLTRAGQQVLEDANVTFTEVLAHLVGAAASPGELEQLSRTIGQLHKHLDATVEILTGHE
jgi:DNA-binding MarR family transcriptional regulator